MHKHRFLIFIIIILILGLIFSPLLPVKDAVYSLLSPFTKMLNSSSQKTRGFFTNIKSIQDLSRENKEAKARIGELEGELVRLKEIEHENQILKEEFGFFQKEREKKLVPAEITSKSVSAYLQNMTINKGTKDGVAKNQAVVSRGYLIGIISETSENFSQVRLVTDAKTIIPVMLQDSRGTGLLRANLSGLFAENIPIDVEIKSGEPVLTSDLGEIIPADIIIGKVETITSYRSQIFQTVKITSPVDFSKLEMVFIIK